jgi:hypothetical protein
MDSGGSTGLQKDSLRRCRNRVLSTREDRFVGSPWHPIAQGPLVKKDLVPELWSANGWCTSESFTICLPITSVPCLRRSRTHAHGLERSVVIALLVRSPVGIDPIRSTAAMSFRSACWCRSRRIGVSVPFVRHSSYDLG